MSERRDETKTDEEREFMEEFAINFAASYEIIKKQMPGDTPPEILAVAIKDLRAALYYREKDAPRKAAAPSGTPAGQENGATVEGLLNALEWNDGKNRSQWAFRTNKDGSVVEAVKPLQGLLDKIKASKYMTIGKWKYSISGEGGKFISRYPA